MTKQLLRCMIVWQNTTLCKLYIFFSFYFSTTGNCLSNILGKNIMAYLVTIITLIEPEKCCVLIGKVTRLLQNFALKHNYFHDNINFNYREIIYLHVPNQL